MPLFNNFFYGFLFVLFSLLILQLIWNGKIEISQIRKQKNKLFAKINVWLFCTILTCASAHLSITPDLITGHMIDFFVIIPILGYWTALKWNDFFKWHPLEVLVGGFFSGFVADFILAIQAARHMNVNFLHSLKGIGGVFWLDALFIVPIGACFMMMMLEWLTKRQNSAKLRTSVIV